MEAIILQILNGLDKGSAYALIALGLTLIFGTLGVVNFAHGALFMIGAFCAVTLQRLLKLSHEVVDETRTDFIINGRFTTNEEQKRLLVEIIRASDGSHVWVKYFEADTLNAEISSLTSTALRNQISRFVQTTRDTKSGKK